MITCAREGCDEIFEPATHNQKYHNSECTRIATNARIMQKYYATRDRKQGKSRFCVKCQLTKLSRYNEDDICNSCKMKARVDASTQVANMLLAITAPA